METLSAWMQDLMIGSSHLSFHASRAYQTPDEHFEVEEVTIVEVLDYRAAVVAVSGLKNKYAPSQSYWEYNSVND